MKTLRVAIGSNDGETIAHSHMGDARWFILYDMADGADAVLFGRRDNPAREMGHADAGKMCKVAGILRDVDVFVAGRMSPNFRKLAAGTPFQPVVVRVERIEEALEILASSFDEVAGLVAARKNGERPETVLKLPESTIAPVPRKM